MPRAGSCAAESREPRQVRKEAAVVVSSGCRRRAWLESPPGVTLREEIEGEVHGLYSSRTRGHSHDGGPPAAPSTPHAASRHPPGRAPAKKSLAQHFLADRRVLRRIVNAAGVSADDLVVEIGAGRGALTRELAGRAGHVIAVEVDEGLASNLARGLGNRGNVDVVTADARELDVDAILTPGAPYKLVGNLPYYAASPIMRRFLGAPRKPAVMVVMVQREVGRSMAAAPGDMSLLSVAVQLYGKPKLLFSVPPHAFRPPPKVTSAVVRIDVYEEPVVDFDAEDRFFTLIKAGFCAPRKQMRNCLKRGLDAPAEDVEAMLEQAGVDPMRRPGTLSLQEWGRLYRAYNRLAPVEPEAPSPIER